MPEWKIIRLELARTPEFPNGSAGRAYMLRVPLDEDGLIDDAALSQQPQMATVRRFWPNEPDRSGYVVMKPGGWAFSYALGDGDNESVYHLEAHPLRLGAYVTLTEQDGERLPFRVTRAQADGVAAEGAAQ